VTAGVLPSCACAGPWEILLEFDAGRVTFIHTGCGREHEVEPEELYSDAMPMTLTRRAEHDVDAGADQVWYELAPRPPST
jgi:hypothetical protein